MAENYAPFEYICNGPGHHAIGSEVPLTRCPRARCEADLKRVGHGSRKERTNA